MWKVVLEPYRAEITDRTEFVALGSLDTLDMTKATPEYLARMLELVDMVLEHRAFPLVTVHDEFKCHANNVQRMREHYNRILWEYYHSDMLFDIMEQIGGVRYQNAAFDPVIADRILQNDYAIN